MLFSSHRSNMMDGKCIKLVPKDDKSIGGGDLLYIGVGAGVALTLLHWCSRLSADIVGVDCQSSDVSTLPRAAPMLITLHCTASVV